VCVWGCVCVGVCVCACVCVSHHWITQPLWDCPSCWHTSTAHVSSSHWHSNEPKAADSFMSVRLYTVLLHSLSKISPWTVTILVLFVCTAAVAVEQWAALTALCALYRSFGATECFQLFIALTWTNERVRNRFIRNVRQTKHTAPCDNTNWSSLSFSVITSCLCAVAIAVQMHCCYNSPTVLLL